MVGEIQQTQKDAQTGNTGTPRNAYRRSLDCTLAIAAIFLLTPLIVSLGAILLAAQGRPLFQYADCMAGNGRRFRRLTFRTRADGALTHVGRALKRSRADELPLLWNVARGDMSLAAMQTDASTSNPEQAQTDADAHIPRVSVFTRRS